MTIFIKILFFVLKFYNVISILLPNIGENNPLVPLNGRICAYGDFNKDRYTDLLVQDNDLLIILLQLDETTFEISSEFTNISVKNLGDVYCSIGDFDGNAELDILVTNKIGNNYQSNIYLNKFNTFNLYKIPVTFIDQPTIMDINGDGLSDIIGFINDESQLFCLAGNNGNFNEFYNCTENFENYPKGKTIYSFFSPIFADFNGDLSAEIVFGYQNSNSKLQLDFWKLANVNYKWTFDEHLTIPMPDIWNFQYFGNPIVADFNADRLNDILIPICRESECIHVTHFAILSNKKWFYFQFDLKDFEIVVEKDSKTLFRVGNFLLDGYPDLIATLKMGEKSSPFIIENIEYSDNNNNFNRKFEIKTTPRLIMTTEMSKSQIILSSFFDLKENGNLDILVEYKTNEGKKMIDFIKCDDKGDTTFLKIQIFSSVCLKCNPRISNKSENIGSGVTWHGACVSFEMSTSWSGKLVSTQCQLPQTSHRTLHSPFALFGLGRSPNFVDEVKLGTPRWPNKKNQNFFIEQIIPNSRIIFAPPYDDNSIWKYSFYLTPSQLIVQSFLVLLSVCGILILLILILHFRERQEDRKERHAQTHRFHFDAM